MAEQAAHHVVNSTQSVGALPLAGVSDNNQLANSTGGGLDNGISQELAGREDIQQASEELTADRDTHNVSLPDTDSVDAKLPNGVHSADSGSTSIGSELDWRRSDSNDASARPPSRERSNSFKKPTSFKTVSVTKNFLAKSVGTSPSPKLSLSMDKASAASPTASPVASLAKPRLVAKTGTNSRAATLSNSASSGAPDPSKVWNRNRPVAPAPPKQFTDEELKQQYGIHLATRLQADEPGKGSKWADMEDDEDDWAPDTVEWMDGTKSTLQPTDEQKDDVPGVQADLSSPGPPQQQQTQPSEPLPESDRRHSSEAVRENVPASVGPGKTILRPGARSSISSSKPGLILRSVPEPASEIPKQTTPGPSRSPWAKLPPVDKISPVAFNPATQIDGKVPPVSYRDYDTPPPSGPSPAREIAADTFERSWREGDRGASRELFDSKSGRYEPVRDKRRPSFKQDGGFRPPSVLQRPSHGRPSESSEGPPIRALLGQDARQWERRRSSVAVEEDGSDSRKALSTSPHSAKASVSDQGQPPSNARTYSAHGPEAAPGPGNTQTQGGENVHELQQQLMRQRIEANRRRKEEEQAKEEAERKERIRQKLIALGPEPPKKHSEQESPEKQVAQVVKPTTEATPPEKPVMEVMPSTTTSDKTLRVAQSSRLEPAAHLDGLGEVPASLTIPKKPSSIAAPETAAKRHTGPDAFSTPQLGATRMSASPSRSGTSLKPTSSDPSVPPLEPGHQGLSTQPKILSENPRNFGRPQQPPPHQQQHWGRTNGGMAGAPNWTGETAAGGPGKVSANVWGPLSRDKSLGNGAFESDMARIPSIGFPPQAQSHPGPIAPPSASPKVNMPSSRSEPSPPGVVGANRPDWKGPGQPPGFPQRPGFAPSDPAGQRHPPGLFGQGHPQAQWQAFGPPDRDPIGDRWNAGDRQRHMHGTPGPESLTPTMTPPKLGSGPHQPHAPPNMAPGGPVSSGARTGSRFFGAGADRHFLASQPPLGHIPVDAAAAASQTAGMDSFLFGEDVSRSTGDHSLIVRLPKPKPRVRLPSMQTPQRPTELARGGPAASPFASRPGAYPTSPTAAVSVPMRTQPVRFGQQPIVAQAEWQNRFDMVTGRKATAAAVASAVSPAAAPMAQLVRGGVALPARPPGANMSTRPAIEMEATASSATVSLPQTIRAKEPALYSLPASMAQSTPGDERLWDEPETGSKPTVTLPSMLPSLAYSSAMLGRQNKASVQVPPQVIQAMVKVAFAFDVTSRIDIHLPGKVATYKYLSRKPTYIPGRHNKGPRKPIQKKGPVKNQAPATPNGVTNREEHEKRSSPRPTKKHGDNGTGEGPSASNRDKKAGWTRPVRSSKGPPVSKTAVPQSSSSS